jgi:hypothetical protein
MDTKSIKNRKSEYELVAFAIFALLVGLAYYWITRPSGSTAFLAFLPAFPLDLNPDFYGWWLGWLPSFTHVFSFSLLTYLAMERRHILFACLLWAGINILFELGQALPAEMISLTPDIFNLHSYLSRGIFDPLDLFASVIGAWAAWEVVRRLNLENLETEVNHHEKDSEK